MIGHWLGYTAGQWLGHVLAPVPPVVPVVTPSRGSLGRSHTIVRVPKRLVRREVQTPDGPLIILVPDDWTTDDLMTLTTALVLTDALD